MKRKETIMICLLLSLWAMLVGEGLFYLNFSPISFHTLGKIWGLSALESMIMFFVFFFILMLNISFIMSHIKYQKHVVLYHLIICLIIFMVSNLALSFIPDIFNKMNFLSEIALLSWVIFVFYTFLYSIFYLNLLE